MRRSFRDHLVDSIETETGASGSLSRQHVEMIYPLLRGRYWTSRNNSLAARSGHFLTPLLDPQIVKASARLPMHWKDYGKFEAKLIARLNPSLARFPLAYSFSPEQGPPAGYRLKTWLQHQRRPWLRAASVGVKRRLKGATGKPQGSPSPLAMSQESPLDALLDASKFTDPAQSARFTTLHHALVIGA